MHEFVDVGVSSIIYNSPSYLNHFVKHVIFFKVIILICHHRGTEIHTNVHLYHSCNHGVGVDMDNCANHGQISECECSDVSVEPYGSFIRMLLSMDSFCLLISTYHSYQY